MDDEVERNMINAMVLAMADGEVSEPEKRFILALRDKLGVTDAQFRDLVQQVRLNRGALSLSPDAAKAAETVRLLTELAAADGEISDPERRMLEKLARQAGVDANAARAAVGARFDEAGASDAEIDARAEEIYAGFASWDAPARAGKVAELAAMGPQAVVGLLRMLESYRVPQGAQDAIELDTLIVTQLGRLGDDRSVYYLAQQINIGDADDEISNAALRFAAAEALGRLVGEGFTPDQQGVKSAREWWFAAGVKRYDRLAY